MLLLGWRKCFVEGVGDDVLSVEYMENQLTLHDSTTASNRTSTRTEMVVVLVCVVTGVGGN